MQAMTLRLPDEVHEALRKEAFESRRSMNAVILDALAREKLHQLMDANFQLVYRVSDLEAQIEDLEAEKRTRIEWMTLADARLAARREELAAAWDEGWERSCAYGYPANDTPGYYDNPYREGSK